MLLFRLWDIRNSRGVFLFFGLLAALFAVLPTPLEMESEPVYHEFELNQPYLEVVSKFWSNCENIMDQVGEKIVDTKDPNTELVYNTVDGFYVEQSQTATVNMKRGGEVLTLQSVAAKRGCMVIKEKLLGDHDYFSEYYVIIEIRRKGLKTVVSTQCWIETHNTPRFLVRAVTRATVKKFEKVMREVVGDLLLEPTHLHHNERLNHLS